MGATLEGGFWLKSSYCKVFLINLGVGRDTTHHNLFKLLEASTIILTSD